MKEHEEEGASAAKSENGLMLDALRGFVIRTASDEAATPEAVQALPEVAKVVLDYQGYC